MEQRSEEWFQARIGKVTASKVCEILAKNKSGAYSDRRKKYMMSLIAERLSGERQIINCNARMIRGNELESIARTEYEIRYDVDVDLVGIIEHGEIKNFAASPDGLIGDDGLIEIKCPETITHINTIYTGKINPDYMIQMQVQMACSGRNWCDFVSYDDRVPCNQQLFCSRVDRDEDMISNIEEEVTKFLNECDGIEEEIRRYNTRI